MNEMTPPQLVSDPSPAGPAAASPIDNFFRLTERGTSVGREVIAGATTFAAMA
jgi:AGZA family xanthine/uracil permease-like MFS transporter